MTEYIHVGAHADVLSSGAVLAPGERIRDKDLDLNADEKSGRRGEDRHLIEAGRLVDVSTFSEKKAAVDAS